MPTEWSTHYAWFLVANPAYVSQGEEAEAALTNAHIQYQLQLHAEGHAIVAGGFAPLAGDPVIGLTVLRAATQEAAQALADADPAVRAGRLLARVRTWWVPTEQLP
ncbi:MAG: YciI family protein [Gemmatimonadales bacterium]